MVFPEYIDSPTFDSPTFGRRKYGKNRRKNGSVSYFEDIAL